MIDTNPCKFIAEVSSNHHQDLKRCFEFIETAATVGCDAVKFQLFKIDQLFAPEILKRSEEHRRRKQWELPLVFLEDLKSACVENNIEFSCTPFYLNAVDELEPFVDFFKIASYELLWDDLLKACAQTKKPVVLSCGMATLDEIDEALETLQIAGAEDITLLHCVSAYPTPVAECNLAVLGELQKRYHTKIGWSDHSVQPNVIRRAISKWHAAAIEFHLDLDKNGAEYQAGHCWLPHEIGPIIQEYRQSKIIDGNGIKQTTASELADRNWRADPSDGLRPLKHIRQGACL